MLWSVGVPIRGDISPDARMAAVCGGVGRCVTYEYGYSFNEIAKTREAANGKRTARNAAGTVR